jgi:AraC-like DNA-binding protein
VTTQAATDRLATLIKSVWSVVGDARDATLPGVVAPDSHVEFVFHFGAPWRMRRVDEAQWVHQPLAFIYAQRYGALRFAGVGDVSVLAFRVTPRVAARILNRDLGELWDIAVPLHDLLGSVADELLATLSSLEAPQRARYLCAWIRRRLCDWDSEDWENERLFEQLMWSPESESIENAAKRLGWSARSLRRFVVRQTSLTPKEVQLAGRHLRACALLREAPTLDVTEIAGRVGFYDSAAFSHGFRERTGMTPLEFRGEAFAFYERHA